MAVTPSGKLYGLAGIPKFCTPDFPVFIGLLRIFQLKYKEVKDVAFEKCKVVTRQNGDYNKSHTRSIDRIRS